MDTNFFFSDVEGTCLINVIHNRLILTVLNLLCSIYYFIIGQYTCHRPEPSAYLSQIFIWAFVLHHHHRPLSARPVQDAGAGGA